MVASLIGCAGHSARTLQARDALDAANPKAALKSLNQELEVDAAEQVPAELSGDNTLLLLDRAMVLQELERYELSSRDLELADKQIEVLDFSRGALDDLGKYMFSDDTGPYKAPTYEKLLINTMNLLNYLVRHDLNGARVEARRLSVLQKYVSDHEGRGASLTGPGSYLAGFTFEKSNEPQEALRYYDEALQYGTFPSLDRPIVTLSDRAGYRTPRLTKILEQAQTTTGASTDHAESATGAATDQAESPADAEILVVVSFGRAPAKVAKRIPIGLALTYASGFISPYDQGRANRLAAQGLVTWINYPELGRARGTGARPAFALDGQWQRLEGALAVDKEVERAWDDVKGAVIASAITRMISRVVAGEVARRGSGGGLIGTLLSLGTQATLTAVDTPDTRNWSTLPARIAIGRVRVKPGIHYVDLGVRGAQRRHKLTLRPGEWAVLALTALY